MQFKSIFILLLLLSLSQIGRSQMTSESIASEVVELGGLVESAKGQLVVLLKRQPQNIGKSDNELEQILLKSISLEAYRVNLVELFASRFSSTELLQLKTFLLDHDYSSYKQMTQSIHSDLYTIGYDLGQRTLNGS